MRRAFEFSRINDSIKADWNLTTDEADLRKSRYGLNEILEQRGNRWFELMKETAKDPMIWFLVMTGVLFALLGHYNQAVILILASIPLIGMDAFLHWRTQVSTESLSSKMATKVVVMRNNVKVTLSATELVPGDLVIVKEGQYFPADGVLVDGCNMRVDESSLSGESLPVEKKVLSTITQGLEPQVENEYWGLAGTRLLVGQATLRVVFTGRETFYGEIILSTLQSFQERTPLQKAIGKLVLILIIAATVFCFILAVVRYYQGFGLIDALLSAATLAVAALPDEFPVVFTFFLGVGIYRLAIKKALVKRSVSVENIGRITTICSDKTGTLTEGQFKLIKVIASDSSNEDAVIQSAFWASRAESGDLLDLAVSDAARLKNIADVDRITTYPFTEDRKRETAIINNANSFLAVSKGAPEMMLSISQLSSEEKQKWHKSISALSESSYKVLAVAIKHLTDKTNSSEPTSDYEFIGLLAFSDPPRKEVFRAIQQCRVSHIHVLMITGDHPETAKSIAREIGLGGENPNVVLAHDLQLTPQTDLSKIDVIARAIPSQKLNIVTALQAQGEIVAVTGDGVNDVPALKAADIGIAMGDRGTQSAREAADIILLDDNFDSIVRAISEGQQLFKNLKLSFKYLLLIHIPFVFSAALIPFFGYPMLFFPIHIVMIELIIHPTAMLVFQDLPESQTLDRVKREQKIHFFTRKDWITIIGVGSFITAMMIGSYLYIYTHTHSMEHARALTLAILCFSSAAFTLSLSRCKNLTSRIVIACTILFTVLLIQVPVLSPFLNLTSLPLNDWFYILIITLISIVLLLL